MRLTEHVERDHYFILQSSILPFVENKAKNYSIFPYAFTHSFIHQSLIVKPLNDSHCANVGAQRKSSHTAMGSSKLAKAQH